MNRAALTRVASYVVVLFLLAGNAAAAVFVVPDDAELIGKSEAIVTGRVIGSFVDDSDPNFVRTMYEIRVDRSMKGRVGGVIQVASPGGISESSFTLVPGAAHFENGQRVLLFLSRQKGHWTPTDMTVGKFRFVTSTGGQALLVRDEEDIVGFDRQMRPHVERIRREETFLRFIDETVRGRAAVQNYFVAPGETVALPKEEKHGFDVASNADYTAKSYAMLDGSGVYGFRWMSNRMSASVTRNFYKNAAQHASGLGDGGVAMITSALNAWTNDCPSVVNIAYAGTHSNLKASDGVNVVVWNDPGGHVGSGGWTGSGTIAIAFLNGAVATYDGDPNWVGITDADIVVQDGLTGAESFMATAMTHEVGHSVGIRHSNTNGTGGSCSASNECSTSAIMRSSVGTLYNYTLQTWDQNAAVALYPGGSCEVCTAPAISSQPVSTSITSGSSANLSVTATGSATLAYQWYRGASGTTSDPVSGATSATLSIAPTATTSYWVRVTNSCGSVNSAAATVTVNTVCSVPSITRQPASVSIFAGQSTTLSLTASSATTMSYQWYRGSSGTTTSPITGATAASLKVTLTTTASYWARVTNSCGFVNSSTATVTVKPIPAPVPVAQKARDFNGDLRADVFWRNGTSGANSLWSMNGGTRTQSATQTVSDLAWSVAAIGDTNLNGRADIIWRKPSTGNTLLWLMSGATVVSKTAQPSMVSAQLLVGSGDFDGDGRADLLWRNTTTGANTVWFMNGTTATAVATSSATDQNWAPAAFGDFNGDNRDDIFWRHRVTGATSIWFMNGATATLAAVATVADLNWAPRGAGDFNGDGRDDLLWRNGSTGANVIWFMNGTTRTASALSTTVVAWRPIAIGDFNANGTADIMWRNMTTGDVRTWLMSGATISSNVLTASMPDAAWQVAEAK